jgi:hypothetical protein
MGSPDAEINDMVYARERFEEQYWSLLKSRVVLSSS